MSSELEQSISDLLSGVQSVQLATLNTQGEPEASYTPFLLHEEKVYIFVSELASHTRNLQSEPKASLLFIEDESRSKNIFARKRVILSGEARFLDRRSKGWGELLSEFEAARGNTVSLLKSLTDFWLVEFNIRSGSYVQGFGQAYRFEGMDFSTLKQETGK